MHNDDEPWPIPVRPWEPPGPLPRRRLVFGRPMVIAGAVIAVAFLALTLFMCVPSQFGASPG